MKEFFWCVEYFGKFVEIVMCCYFCATFIVKEKTQDMHGKIIFLSLAESLVIILFNQMCLFSYIITFIFIFICIITQWIMYRRKYLYSVALVLAYATILYAIDFMVAYFIAIIKNTNTAYLLGEQSFVRVACILLSKCILIIIVITLNKVIAYKKTVPIQYIVIMSLCSGFLLISNFVMIHSELNKSSEEINSFSVTFFIASLGIEMIIFWFVIKIAEGYEQKKNASLIELNNKMLKKSLDETEHTFELWKQRVHDYKNNIISLTQLVEEGKIEELKSYLKKENDLMETRMFYFKTGNSVIDAIINAKQNIAEKKGIVFVVNAVIPKKTVVSDIDMANILGNLIDNAIEAEQKEREPYIEITIKLEKSFLIINIRNKCTYMSEVDINTSKKETEFHGIGLRSVKKTVRKYDGEIRFSVSDNEFIVNILIQNKND